LLLIRDARLMRAFKQSASSNENAALFFTMSTVG